MTKNTTKNANRPTTQPEEIIADVQAMSIEDAENVVQLNKAKGKRRNIFETDTAAITETAAGKVQLVSEARQRLAEAKDYYDAGGQEEAKGQEALDKSARLLIQGRVTGVLTADEVTEIVGSQFGFKTKKDGTPSKTPNGAGNTVRQRIVRLVNAYSFAEDGRADDAFFAPMGEDAQQPVRDLLQRFENGEVTIWTAYGQEGLAGIKSDHITRVPLVQDAKKIAGIANSIGENVNELADLLATDKALRTAYRSLWQMLGVVAEEAGERAESEAAE